MLISAMRKKTQKAAIYQMIRNNIIKFRKEKNMTQKELGLALKYPEDYAQQRIWQYEKGRRSPSPETIEAMAKIFGKPFIAFYFENYDVLIHSGQISPPVDRQITEMARAIVAAMSETRKKGAA